MSAGDTNTAREADGRDARLALDGDTDAFERLVRRHQASVSRLMWRFAHNAEDQADLSQEVFITFWNALGTWRREGDLEHWLRRIAVRVGYSYWRRTKRQDQRLEYSDTVEDLADRGAVLLDREERERLDAAAEAAEIVHGLLARLSDRDRLVLTLLHLEELSVAEVAAATGWSQSLVKVQAHRARARMRKLLEAER